MKNLLRSVGFCCLVLACGFAAADHPNVLIVIADDATFNELPLYGGRNLRTPNLDRLAAEGLLFRRAYLSMAMCTPCRTELYTGLYPMRSGVCWNHAAAKPGTRSIAQHLGDLGYRVGLAGKVHVQPRATFSFEMVDGLERNCVADKADHDCRGIGQFMARDAKQPFCLVVALVVPHAPWTVGNPEHFDRAKLMLPPYMVDTPETRKCYAAYLAEMEVMDQQLGDILKTLDSTGQAGRTVVLFTSEQGGQWPGCKWTNWDEGVHTALVARWPGRIRPGRRSDALVQYADVLPTLVEAAGGDPAAAAFDGSSFLPVLLGRAEQHRKFVYAMHNNLPEGPPYPIRSVCDGRFHYIRNLTPSSLYIEKHVMGATEHSPYWLTWVWKTADDPHALAMVERYLRRPAEHLYDLEQDPFEMRSLAGDPQHAAVKTGLSAELDRWMLAQGDPGAELDTPRARQGPRKPTRPNIIFVLTDDLGYGDLGCYGGRFAPTPNLDRMAREGVRFTQFYVTAPICSASRTGVTTGMFPARWRMTSYLQTKAGNRACQQADFLDPRAPSLARTLKTAGYATAHFGKWHMGGGRDVSEAPGFAAYGFDEHASTWESPEPHPDITATNWIWSPQDKVKRWDRTAFFVDKTLDFLRRHQDRPCYVNLWPDDTHTPWVPGQERLSEYPNGPDEERKFSAVLDEYDRQIGRLLAGLKSLGLDEKTLVLFTSDNGPLPTFQGRRAGGLRGSKLSLYEGGIRMPCIARWPGHAPAGFVNAQTVMNTVDLFPSLCALAGAALPEGAALDGEDLSHALLGQTPARTKPMLWEYGRNEKSFAYPKGADRSPNVAVRDGKWKLLVHADGSRAELYDLEADAKETTNLAGAQAEVATRLRDRALAWRKSLPE